MKKTIRISFLSFAMVAMAISCKKNQQQTLSDEQLAGVEAPVNTLPLTKATFAKDNHDFGTMQKGQVVQNVYEVTNTGDKPLVINEVRPACGCTVPDYTKGEIAAGQKGQVTLSFDSKNFSGQVTKTAEVFMNAENSPVVLSFKANVQ